MKKYQQLLIVSLGLVSFICFLIYKHEYDRLRNVLEVLEVFGTAPPQTSALAQQGEIAHPLELGHNPNLGVGSINELKLGQGGLVELPKDQDKLNPQNVPAQNSGEVMDEGGGGAAGGDAGIGGKLSAIRSRKRPHHHSQQESIFNLQGDPVPEGRE